MLCNLYSVRNAEKFIVDGQGEVVYIHAIVLQTNLIQIKLHSYQSGISYEQSKYCCADSVNIKKNRVIHCISQTMKIEKEEG